MSEKKPFALEPRFASPVGPWRRFFAWRPCRTYDGALVWLRFAWKRRVQKYHYLDGGPDFWWQVTDVEVEA